MSIERPSPRTKAYDKWIRDLHNMSDRQFVLDLLREKYQLTLLDVARTDPEIVRERQKRYDEHLARLNAIWKEEDRELEGID